MSDAPATPEPLITPPAALHTLPAQVVKAEAEKYFGAPIIFTKRGPHWYCLDNKTRVPWGKGYCQAAAVVDGIARMEMRKARAKAEYASKNKNETKETEIQNG